MRTSKKLLHSAALKNAESILIAAAAAERELLATKEALERTTQELQEVRVRLERTLSQAEIGTWTWDVCKERLTADQNLARMFSLSSDVAAGVGTVGGLSDFDSPPTIGEQVKHAISRALSGEDDSYEVDFRAFLDPMARSVRGVSRRSGGGASEIQAVAATYFPGGCRHCDMSPIVSAPKRLFRKARRSRNLLAEVVASSE